MNRPPAVGDFFLVSQLSHAGLNRQDEKRLFAADGAVQLFRTLEIFVEDARKLLLVEGSPGLGKSCSAWAWACAKGLQDSRHVVWVHITERSSVSCVLFHDRKCKVCDMTPEGLPDLLRTSRADVIVFDGFGSAVGNRYDASVSALVQTTVHRNRKVIVVASMGVFLKPADFGLTWGDFSIFEMNPWKFADYEQACADFEFFQSVRNKFSTDADAMTYELLSDKYFYAGASARWMFEMEIPEIIRETNWYLSKADTPKALIESNARIASATGSKHLLMRIRHDDDRSTSFFVSKYAMQQTLEKFERRGLGWAYKFSAYNSNRANFGWVLEFDFVGKVLAAAKSTKQLILLDRSNKKVEWKVDYAERKNLNEMDLGVCRVDHWMIPCSSSQAGFDAACLFDANGHKILRVVQVTCAARHSLRLDAFAQLVANIVHNNPGMMIEGLEVILLLPKFADARDLEAPVLSVCGPGLCEHLRVGATPVTWAQGDEQTQVSFCGLEVPVPYFAGL